MIKSEARMEKTTTAVAPISDNEEKLFAFDEILRGIEEKNNREIIPILERIEFNTSFLKKTSKQTAAESRPVTAQGIFPRVAPLRRRDEKGRFALDEGTKKAPKVPVVTARLATEEDLVHEEKKRQATSSATAVTTVGPEPAMQQRPQEAATEAAPVKKEQVASKSPRGKVPDETKGERDNRGRFIGKSKSQEARSEQRNKDEKKSLFESLKDGIGGVGAKGKSAVAANAGTIEEAAGRAAGGPIFEAAMELKGAVDSARDEDSMIGKAARWAGKKTGISKGEEEKPSKEGRDEKGRFLTGTAKADDGSKKIIETLKGSENEDEKRHEELIKTILKGNKEKGPESMGLPSARRTGPGARAKEKLQKAMKKSQLPTVAKAPRMPGGGGPGGGILSTLLSRFALPGMAVVGAGLAGAAVGTAINSLINSITEKVSDGKHKTAGDAFHDFVNPESKGVRNIIGDVESGRKGYSAYQNKDSGIVSAGKYQFTAAGGEKSSLAKVLDNYAGAGGARTQEAQKYSAIIKSGKAESLRNDAGFRSFLEQTGNDKIMQQAQEKTFDQNYFNPAIGYAQRQGINAIKMPKLAAMMVDTNIQGGMADVTQATSRRLAQQGKTFKTASEEEIMNLFVEERKNRLDRVASQKEAKGDTKTASMLRNSKGRVDNVRAALDKNEKALRGDAYDIAVATNKERVQPSQDEQQPVASGPSDKASPAKSAATVAKTAPSPAVNIVASKDDSTQSTSKTIPTETVTPVKPIKKRAFRAVARKEPPAIGGEITREKASSTDQPANLAKGESSREKASPMAATTVEPVEPIVTATATPVADIRKRILSRTRARTAALGGGSLEAKPIEGGAMATEPATSLATGMPARSVRQPERMTTARAEIPEAPSSIPGPKQAGSDMNGVFMAAIDKLNATMAKMTGQDEAKRSGVPPIRTEFDDTMLTLMAYDRV
jgi:hypothetical protein